MGPERAVPPWQSSRPEALDMKFLVLSQIQSPPIYLWKTAISKR